VKKVVRHEVEFVGCEMCRGDVADGCFVEGDGK